MSGDDRVTAGSTAPRRPAWPNSGASADAAQRTVAALIAEAEQLRDETASELLAIRRRCASRLRSLVLDVARVRSPAPLAGNGPGPVDLEDRLHATVEAALRQIEDIVARAYHEVIAMPGGELDQLGAGEPAAADADQDAADAVLLWVAEVMRYVGAPFVARLLQSMKDPAAAHRVAMARPLLMSDLLQTMTPAEAAGWLSTWPPQAAAETLTAMGPEPAARHLELLPGPQAGRVLDQMGRESARQCLAAMDRGKAARRLAAMDRAIAGELLVQLDRDVAAECLMQLDSTQVPEFLRLLPPEAASECLRLIDRQAAERAEAAEIMRHLAGKRFDPGAG